MTETTQFLIDHGLPCVFAAVLLEQIGLPLPALPFLLAAGALSAIGKFDPMLGIGATVLACVMADTFWFYLGRRRGVQVLGWLCRISLEPDSCVRRTQNVFTRYGLRGLLVAKFVPGLSTIAPPLAGMSGVGFGRFLWVDALGSLIYGVTGIGAGYLFSNQIGQIGAAVAHIGGSALSFLIALAALYVAYKYWQRQRLLRELHATRITVDVLHQMLQSDVKPFVLDLRSKAELQLDPTVIRGSVHVEADKIMQGSQIIPRDRDVIVYCSCPNEITSAKITLMLKRKGFKRIHSLLGGIQAWRKQNYPIEAWSGILTVTEGNHGPALSATNL
jgi:membrane protein DedA with SNARE-associated domain/rhodanese-related sulfurtransferase